MFKRPHKKPTTEEIALALERVERDPTNVRAMQKLGDAYAKAKEWKQAAEAYIETGELYEADGGTAKAIAVYKQILKWLPEHLPAHEHLAAAYVASERWNEAIETYRTIADLCAHTNHPVAIAALEEALQHIEALGKWEDCIAVSEQLLRLSPEHLGAFRLISHAALELNDTKAALSWLQQGFRKHKEDPVLLEMMAEAFARLGQYNKSVSILKTLAEGHAAKGDHELAREFYQQALEYDPNNTELQLALSALQDGTNTQDNISTDDLSTEDLSYLHEDLPIEEDEKTTPGMLNPLLGERSSAQDESNTVNTHFSPPEEAALPQDPEPIESSSTAHDEAIVILYQAEKYIQYGLIPQAEEAISRALALDPQNAFGLQLQAELQAKKQGS